VKLSIKSRFLASCSLVNIAALGSALCVLNPITSSAATSGLPLQQSELDVLARQFAEPLVPTVATSAADDVDLLTALKKDRQSSTNGEASALAAFAASHPASGWRPSVLTNLAFGYERDGSFSRAIDALEQAWTEGQHADGLFAKRLVDRAAGELLFLHARFGHADQVSALLATMASRNLTGRAGELRDQAKGMLWRMRHDPNRVLRCGPKALEVFLRALGASAAELSSVKAVRVGSGGSTLAELSDLAHMTRFESQIIRRNAGAPVPVPSVIHWKVGHFAAVVGTAHGRYEVVDSTSGADPLWISQQTIDAEASGYFLVATKKVVPGWQQASIARAGQVFGAGAVGPNYELSATTPDDIAAQDGGAPGAPNGCNHGMCGYSFTEMAVSLRLNDTPVGYTPPKGPPVFVSVSYNQREAEQPANMTFFNVSPKWSLSWLAYIQDEPGNPGVNVIRVVGGGGGVVYLNTSFNPGTGSFPPDYYDGSTLTYNGGASPSYTRTMADGSVEIYGLSNGATSGTRYIFLTKRIDPAGNAVTLNYNQNPSMPELISITDALGQQTTFSYGDTNYPLQVTKITDPFGRYATLQYDDNKSDPWAGQLLQITDVLGLTSQFGYDSSSYVNSLTTPYGTTTFTHERSNEPNYERYVTATDPLGNTERLEFLEGNNLNGVSPTEKNVPTGLLTENDYLDDRDTFYWDKHAYAVGYTAGQISSYANAHMRHWCHSGDIGPMSNTVESERSALESRIWYNYPGTMEPPLNAGTSNKPTAIARVLDSGATQLTLKTYDPVTINLTSVTDPVGRQTKYNYYGNHIDLASVQQVTSSGPVNIASFGAYSAQHRPSSYTDAASQTTNFGYNSAGQVNMIVDPLNEVTQLKYSGNNYLQKITNADNLTAATFGYDGFGRVSSVTDSLGWTVNFGYDNLDRLRLATFPDATSRSYNYTNLDLTSVTDRQSRTTSYGYNADRYLTSIKDPAGDVTMITPYENGVTHMLQDPNNHITTWPVDIESRVTGKSYNNGAAPGYAIQYEASTSRPHSVTDALNQVKTFAYYTDDRLFSITYSNTVNPTPYVAFGYDPAFPRVTTMVDGNGTTTYGYYPTGMLGALHLASESPPFANSAIAYSYDALGRVSGRSVGGNLETMGYDKIGRLATHVNDLGTFQLGYLGQTAQVTSRLSGLLGTDWGYLGNRFDRRLRSIVNTPGGSRYQYATTPENDIAGINEDGGYQTWMYGYDGADRLTGANASVSGAFGYGIDAASNFTSIQTPSGTTAVTPNALNQIAQYGQTNFSYDANGNLTADYARTYAWDAENRLIGIGYPGTPGASTLMAYDGLGRRTAIQDNNGSTITTTHYGWCGETLCQARTPGANGDVPSKRYFAEGEEGTTGASELIYGIDQLGSVRDAIGAQNGLRQRHYDYDPYGNLISTVGILTVQTDMRYAGLFAHSLSGLYLATRRAFDPVTGRWISRDPLEEPGGVNLYGYAGDNPISRLDPLGLSWQSNLACFIKGAGIGAGGALLIGGGVIAAGALGAPVALVSAALLGVGAIGAVAAGVSGYSAYSSGDYDSLSYTVGSFLGGAAAGGGLASSVPGVGSGPLIDPVGEVTNFYNPFHPDGANYANALAKGPTPGGAAGALSGAGAGTARAGKGRCGC
jgi:RHS repeat-associated protein